MRESASRDRGSPTRRPQQRYPIRSSKLHQPQEDPSEDQLCGDMTVPREPAAARGCVGGTVRRRLCCFGMDALADYSSLLLAIDFLLAVILLDIEVNDPMIKLERVEARRQAIRRRDSERYAAGSTRSRRDATGVVSACPKTPPLSKAGPRLRTAGWSTRANSSPSRSRRLGGFR